MFYAYEMISSAISIIDKANQVKFFEKTFLVANVNSKIVFRMFFFTLSNANINFLGQKLYLRIYIS